VFALVAAIAAVGLYRSGWELAGSMFFFRNYLPADLGSSYTQHLWSLSVEEHFYVLWPGLLVWIGVRSAQRWAAYSAIGFGMWRVVNEQMQLPMRYLPAIAPHFRTDLRLDALLWGCVVAFLLHDERSRADLTASLRPSVWALILSALCLAIFYYSSLTSLWIAMIIPVVLAGTVLHPRWFFSRALQLAPLAWIGRISYSLYLWQQVFLVAGWEQRAFLQRWPVNLIATFGVAAVSYYALERPAMRLGRQLAARFTAPRANAVAPGSALLAE
jgi:peptidoglycan/LPS O-acetylase OafA/YrhL